jgi:osmotically-inducible protein OsmY
MPPGLHGLYERSNRAPTRIARPGENSMRFLLISAIAVTMAFTLTAADLTGTWKGSMETQMGTTEVSITIQPGAALAGKVKKGEYEAAIEKGKVDGDKISFEVNIDPGKVAYEGTVAGDEMKLRVTGTQGNQYTLTCKRQK